MRSGFNFSQQAGFSGSTGKTQQISYTRRTPKRGHKPAFADGGRVVDSALQGRVPPSNGLDQESGGTSPLRPGFTRGGYANKYANGGQVSKQPKATRASFATSAIAASSPSSESKSDMKRRMTNAQDRIMGTYTPDSSAKPRYAKGGLIPAEKVASREAKAAVAKHVAHAAPKGHKGLKSC